MTINEYLQYLVDTDLHNLHLKDDETGLVRSDKYRLLLTLIRAGIRELNTRFALSEQVSQVIELHRGTHIIDAKEGAEPWRKDIISIYEVYLMGIEPKNIGMQYLPEPHLVLPESRLTGLQALEKADPEYTKPSYYLTNPTTIHLYSPYDFAVYQLVCRTAQGANSELQLEDELPLPLVYHNALGLYIASRLYRSMDNQLDGDLNESTRFYQAYQHELQLLDQQGITLDKQPQDTLFTTKGFV